MTEHCQHAKIAGQQAAADETKEIKEADKAKKASVKARAKINLSLDITGLREDGYHLLDMIMIPCDLHDVLHIQKSTSGKDEILCQGMELPENNTLAKTLAVLRNQADLDGFWCVELEKNIPSQAGLGGASADAAALLRALNDLEHLGLDEQKLREIGVQIGADVPFCLYDLPARVKGIGEQIEPLESAWPLPVLVVQAGNGISTPAAFAAYDKNPQPHPDTDKIEKAFVHREYETLLSSMENVLEKQALDCLPDMRQARQAMKAAGADFVLMTGSGSAQIGFFKEAAAAKKASQDLRRQGYFAWSGLAGTSSL